MKYQKCRTLWHVQRPPRTRMPQPERTRKRPYVEPFSLPPTLIIFFRYFGYMGTTVPTETPPRLKAWRDRSAIAKLPKGNLAEEGEKTTRKNEPDQSQANLPKSPTGIYE